MAPTPTSASTWVTLAARTPATQRAVPNLFAGKSWYVPPPAPPVRPTAPAPPTAPPLPFSYLGRLQEAPGRVTVFLARGDKVYTVRLGDVIDDAYQVDALANGQLTLTYLPLNVRQSLAVGNDS